MRKYASFSDISESETDGVRAERRMQREEMGSVSGRPGWIFDTPRMDLRRDIQFEKGAQIRDGPYYDAYAAERTLDHAHAMHHKDPVRAMAALAMTPERD